jgi:uncharacterized protein
MDLSNEFEVPLSIDETWSVLTDLERVAPCLPGAQLDEVEGDEYRGRVKIKVGPITVEYKGTASFVERVVETHVAVLRASGRETKGQGSASATITATLQEVGAKNTKVSVLTALDISGRVAQFGRGALADVSSKILGQFAVNLEKDLAAGNKPSASAPSAPSAPAKAAAPTPPKPAANGAATAKPAAPTATAVKESASAATESESTDGLDISLDANSTEAPSAPTIRKVNSAPAEPVRVVGMVGSTLLKRLAPVAALGVIALVVLWLRRSRMAE